MRALYDSIRRPLALGLCLAGLALASGCGGDEEGEPIPQASAARLNERLGEIQRRFDAGGGACADLEESRQDVQNEIDELPEGVDQDVRDALEESFERLFTLAIEDCDEERGQTTETTPEPPPPIPQPTVPEQTDTQPTETEEEPPPKKPEQDKRGQGRGGNDGNDGDGGDRGGGTGGAEAPEVGGD